MREAPLVRNRVKEKFRQGKLALGTYVYLFDPAVVELVGIAGFDAVFIDMEHSGLDLQQVGDMVRACELVGISSLVRVPDNDAKTILRVLEMGAQGIQVPHITGKDDALAAVKAVRYAPLGERGMGGPTRARRYGSVPMDEHIATSNSEVLLSAMVEDESTIGQLADIAATEGVDMIAIGPSDLAQSMGITDAQNPRLLQTIESMAQTIRSVGKAKLSLPIGNQTYSFSVADLKRLGVAYSNCNPADVSRLLSSYQQQMKELRSLLD
jgi:2-keto-3-deoxy-L-rhamnonate aldolase RhmA